MQQDSTVGKVTDANIIIEDTGWVRMGRLADSNAGGSLSALQLVDADNSPVNHDELNLGALGRCSMSDTLSPTVTNKHTPTPP